MTLGGLLGGTKTAIVWPNIKIGKPIGLPMAPTVMPFLIRTVVDTHVHLPDMFELTFHDLNGTVVADAGLKIGAVVEISAGPADSDSTTSLIKGEVTSIEAICQEGLILSIVRGYEKAHRLQRAKRTKTYVNMKDHEIAEQVAKDAGLDTGKIEATTVAHDHIAQIAQTDWDFLQQRAREIGYETGVVGGKFFFRKAGGRKDSGGGLGGLAAAAVDAAASMLGLSDKLTFKDNLRSFLPRISAANITPDVEVRVWDPLDARVAVAKTDAASGTATVKDQDPAKLAKSFTDGLISLPSMPSLPSIPGLPKLDFGLPASNTAYLVVNRPLGVGPAADTAAEAAAKGVADHIASTFAEAEGDAAGDPKIQAGSEVEIAGVPEQFCGKWFVTNARHVFDPLENGYHTRFWVSGRQNRSLLGLTGGGAPQTTDFGGLVCGIVTNVKDDKKLGRVKVALPWLAPNFESDWARVVQFGAGAKTGALFLPSVGDEVLVGFEFGDSRRPYVLGGLINSKADFGELKNAVAGSGIVTKRGIATPAANQLTFTDELPPGPPGSLPPIQSKIQLGTKGDKIGLVIDQVAGTVTLACNPKPPESKSPNGALTIECADLGGITIKGGMGGVKIETDGQLSLNGKAGVKIESTAIVEIKGSLIKLN
jgi:phage protein D